LSLGLKVNQGFVEMAEQDFIMDMMRKHRKNRQLVLKTFLSVCTNCNVHLDTGIAGFGVYPTLARSNHSCAPNTEIVAAPHLTRGMALRATRSIAPGEEITWCYLQNRADFLDLDYLGRNALLVSMLRFACQCPRCRREQLPQLRSKQRLLDWFDRALERSIASRLDAAPDSDFLRRQLASAVVSMPTIELEALHESLPVLAPSRRCSP
jgi:hypothetical protein